MKEYDFTGIIFSLFVLYKKVTMFSLCFITLTCKSGIKYVICWDRLE